MRQVRKGGGAGRGGSGAAAGRRGEKKEKKEDIRKKIKDRKKKRKRPPSGGLFLWHGGLYHDLDPAAGNFIFGHNDLAVDPFAQLGHMGDDAHQAVAFG